MSMVRRSKTREGQRRLDDALILPAVSQPITVGGAETVNSCAVVIVMLPLLDGAAEQTAEGRY